MSSITQDRRPEARKILTTARFDVGRPPQVVTVGQARQALDALVGSWRVVREVRAGPDSRSAPRAAVAAGGLRRRS